MFPWRHAVTKDGLNRLFHPDTNSSLREMPAHVYAEGKEKEHYRYNIWEGGKLTHVQDLYIFVCIHALSWKWKELPQYCLTY